MGWFGMLSQMLYYLGVVNADQDEEGRFKIGGMVTVGIGGDEVVVHEDAHYFTDGRKCMLAAGLNGTSYGVRGIKVF